MHSMLASTKVQVFLMGLDTYKLMKFAKNHVNLMKIVLLQILVIDAAGGLVMEIYAHHQFWELGVSKHHHLLVNLVPVP